MTDRVAGNRNQTWDHLSDFLQRLEELGELHRIPVEVDPLREIGPISRKLNTIKGPAVLFERVKGFTIPVVAQLLGSRRRVAIALDSSEGDLFQEMAKRSLNLIPPKLVSRAPCQEVIRIGQEVNLEELPLVMNNPNDGGLYITAGHVFQKDPELGCNLAIYRMMLHSRNELFIRLVPGHHGWAFVKKAEERGAGSFPIAVAIGVDPTIYIASQFTTKLGTYELEIAGGLRNKPVEVVRCKTIDMEVPACAEIILEGEVKIPPKTGTEGPFGEFTGYTSELVENERIMTVKAITHRKNPIYQNIWLGRPIHEYLYVSAMTYAVQAYHELKSRFPAVKAAYAPPSGVTMKLVIQIDGKLKYPGMVNDLLASAISTGLWKEIVAVDEDIDLFNSDEVDWAVVTRVQPDRDIFILPGGHGIYLDPSSVSEGISAKLFIDATKKKGFRGKVVEPTTEMMQEIEAKWNTYGFRTT